MGYIFLLLLISNLILIWSETILCMISILCSLLGLILWPSVWSILVNVPCVLKTIVHSVVVEYGVLWIAQWLTVVFKFSVSLLNCSYLFYQLLRERGVKNCGWRFVYVSLQFCQFCFMYFKALLLGSYIFRIFVCLFSDDLILLSSPNVSI